MRDFLNDMLTGDLATPDYLLRRACFYQIGRIAVHMDLIELSGVMKEYPHNIDLEYWQEALLHIDEELAKTNPSMVIQTRNAAINFQNLVEILNPCETDEEATISYPSPIAYGTCYFNTVQYEIRSWVDGEWVSLGDVDYNIAIWDLCKKDDPFKVCHTLEDFKVLVFGKEEDDDW